MTQRRLHSAVEACVNTGIGLAVGLASQLAVFPLVGLQVTWSQNWAILVSFTIISLVRNYVVRRIFNRWRRVR